MISAMVTTMDQAGRLVIPSDIRREAALEPGTPLDIRYRDGVIEIEPQPLSVTFVRERRLLVARPEAKTPALTTAIVERTRGQLAARRGGR
jgi:AbrB family looped-hinge helix DNA binding protein